MHTTTVSARTTAPASVVYAALLDPAAVERWRVPDGMSARVELFEPRTGGRFRVTLTYDDPEATGKTAGASDTYDGHFARLVPHREVVEVLSFDTDDSALGGLMRMTTTLTELDGGTDITLRHEGIPDAVSPADNETGSRMALDRLVALVEHRRS